MKDRLYMVLAFAGVIVLIIVYAFNRDTSKSVVNYDAVDSFYVPKDQAYNNDNAANEIFAELNGSRSVHCPVTELKNSTAKTPVSIATGTQRSTYGCVCFPVSRYATNRTDVIGRASDLESMTGYDKMTSTNPVSLADLGATATGGTDGYYELIAPFSFMFSNNNTDGTHTIQIINTSGTCRITYSNIANWGCAGSPGTITQTGSGTYEDTTTWIDHDKKHLSVWGKSSNAIVKKGIDGTVIGYGTPETTITIEKLSSEGAVPISIYEFITSVSN